MTQAMRSIPNMQDGSILQRVRTEGPYLSRCSDNKTAALIRPIHYAVRYPYMQVNRQDMVSWLIFDLDHQNANIWDDAGLPAPNLIVRNRKNGHSHLYYAIVPVCTSENARSKPIQYMKAIYQAMAIRLQADPAYSGPVAKTPGHSWWDTSEIHNFIYDLDKLAESVEFPAKRWNSGPDIAAVSHSRHCTLFEELRFYAYSIVEGMRQTSSYQRFVQDLDAYAHNRNNFRSRGFDSNLSISQVKATVKSVARWTWDHYTGNSRCHRGAMALDPELPLSERQSLSAKRTHAKRSNDTRSRIRAACHQLRNASKRITITAIATITQLSRQTIAKYKAVWTESTDQQPVVVSLCREADKVPVQNVNYGAHQISAPAVFYDVVGISEGVLSTLIDELDDS